MTTPPPEPPAPWPPSPDERPASQRPRPGPRDKWRAFQRHPGDQPGNGHEPAPGYPPENGRERAPGQPPGPGHGPDDYPDYAATPGYRDLPDYPRDGYEPTGHPPMPDYPAADHRPMPDHPLMPDYPAADHRPMPNHPLMPDYPAADRPPMPNHPPMPDYPAADRPLMPDHPPAPGYTPTADYPRPHGYRAAAGSADAAQRPPGYPVADYRRDGYPPGESQMAGFAAADGGWVLEGAPVTHEEYAHPGDGPASAVRTPPVPADAAPATGPDGPQWAMLAYLTVPFFGFLVPLTIYLISLRRSPWLRAHAAQAVNVWLTVILYNLSALIIGAVFMLDSPRVALAVVVPLVTVLWLTTLAFLVRAAARASRGETYAFPRWLCTPMVR